MDLGVWLRGLGLERYEQAFREGEIDLEVLPELTDADLKELGLPLGPRRKLLKAILALSDGADAKSPPETAVHFPAERRQLSVLFVDLVGSTALSARLDPEDMGAVIRAYHGACAEVVERWGGHVAKYMGDGVLAYFGWPRAHEDEAERAVRAGLELVEAVSALDAPGLALGGGREKRLPLAARIGIATGLVMVGELIGEGAAREQTVVGETPNLAARTPSSCGAGQRGDQPDDAPAGRRPVRAGRSGAGAAQGLRRAALGLPGRRRGPCGGAVRRAPRRASHAAGRARARARHPAGALGLGQGWRRPGGAARGRARDRQVAPAPHLARAPGRRAAHAAQPLLLAASHQQRAVSGDRPFGADGAARARGAGRRAAGQARGGACGCARPAARSGAAARRPARGAEREGLSGAQPDA